MLRLVNDWMGMWMRYVLQWVWLQRKDPFKEMGVGEDLAEIDVFFFQENVDNGI